MSKPSFSNHIILALLSLLIFSTCESEKKTDSSKTVATNPPTFHWQMQHSGVTSSIRGLNVLNENVAWLSGSKGAICKTTDGGKTWQKVQVPDADSLDFRDLKVFNENEVLLMSAGPGTASRIYKTKDAGQTWQLIKTNDFEKGFYNGIAFWDNQNGILAGDPIDEALFILKTSDGGETWQRIPVENMPKVEEGEYGFAASGTHIATGENGQAWIATGGKVARVFYSENGGDNWTVTNTPMISGEAATGTFSLDFKNKMEGIAVGGDYTKEKEGKDNLMQTKDGGKTWNLISHPMDYRSCVQIVDDWTVAVGPSGSDISLNGGQTWAVIDTVGFHTMSIGGSKQAIWAAGGDGRVGKLMQTIAQ